MSRTVIDLDDDALAEAAQLLGTTTKKDTVNAALREIADRRRRAAAIERMRQMVDEGEIDFGRIGHGDADRDADADAPADGKGQSAA
ncbi:type II toxin-antitoxin system VapB family antitoxin [Streptomyces erythrochromogenes]|uniref:type II toxin-antitoxin system VapB family antitoxin n=1 Tax=Streptomyces erythrochromogenes TaxID=285574 RepID=UPI00386BD0BE|nr:type II toxin-antitoxin system VapB family antitoxin [Streptomyces erythrochromogenes]